MNPRPHLNPARSGPTFRGLTYAAFIADAAARLDAVGVESPGADAEWILAAATGGRRLDARIQPNRELTPDAEKAAASMLARRLAREPLQYILGEQPFLNLTLRVNRDTLIPRPETEQLVLAALACMHGRPGGLRVLDWGAGSGCIALALAAALPDAEVFAVDRSEGALAAARANARRCGLERRVRFFLGDGFAALPDCGRFDLVVSNPPYIPRAEVDRLAPEIRDFEPRLALDGGPDGLDCFRRLASEGRARVRPDGLLAAEFGDGQGPALEALFAREGWGATRFGKDLSGTDRILIVEASSAA